MCGIAGFVGWDLGRTDADTVLSRMLGAIEHRGPDDEGRFLAPGVALGMRRLSIIDVAGGAQPISNENGDVQVVFNGEIYNHRTLRTALEEAGHRFATRSDTETIVHSYEDHGLAFAPRLRGMFGLAIWDVGKQRLLLARDRVGIKPLYYWLTPDGLAFASELRSFLALDRFPRTISRSSVGRYLALGYVPDPHCIFEGVRKLPPGHLLTWSAGSDPVVERYWAPPQPQVQEMDEGEAVLQLRHLLRSAVGSHLESEVPLGAFLSGGIDSSTVVALMAEQTNRPVQTFSIGFPDKRFDESEDAAAVARSLGTEHTELILQPEADRLIEDVIRVFDEPFADSSALPTLLVAELARRQVTVVLSGDGGDELFGGYARYADLDRKREWQPAALRGILGMVGRTLPFLTPGRNRLIDLSRRRSGRYTAAVALPLQLREGGFAGHEIAETVGPLEELLGSHFAEVEELDFRSQMMLVDLMSYLPGDILTKVDRTTMATSLEARVPLLDHELVEFAMSVPSRLKMRQGVGKWILRRAIEDLVPPQVLTKPKKGFSVPLGRWFNSDLRHRVDALLVPEARVYEFVDQQAVKRLVFEHRVGRRDRSGDLWRLMALDLWLGLLDSGDLGRPSPGIRGP